MRKSGVKMVEVNTLWSCDTSRRFHRDRAVTILEPKWELHSNLSQWQQSELEFHDSNLYSSIFGEEEIVALMREALKWRRACFWYSGQQREGMKKMKSTSSSRLSFAIVYTYGKLGRSGLWDKKSFTGCTSLPSMVFLNNWVVRKNRNWKAHWLGSFLVMSWVKLGQTWFTKASNLTILTLHLGFLYNVLFSLLIKIFLSEE